MTVIKLYAPKFRTVKKKTERCTVKNYVGGSILVYRLVCCTDSASDSRGEPYETEYFSISVIRLGDDGTRDEKTLPDVSRDRGEAESIYEKFVRGTVPPEVAEEVIDDILGAM